MLKASSQLGNEDLEWRQGEPVKGEGLVFARLAGEEQARLGVAEVEDDCLLLVREVEYHEAGLPCARVMAQEGEVDLAVLAQRMVIAGYQSRR